MIGQVISQTLGLSLLNTGASQSSPQVEAVNAEEQGQSHNQAAIPQRPDVSISDLAKELSLNSDSDEPNWKQVQMMASQLASNMDSLFLKAGIDTSKPVRINIHPYTGIPFVGEHPDKGRIQRLLDDTPDLLQQIKNVNTVASYSYQVSQSNHGLSSSATPMSSSTTQSAQPESNKVTSTRLQNALEQYEQTTQITRISMQYEQDVGITLDVLGSNKSSR